MQVRVVLDTNVLVSGLVAKGGAPHRILDKWLEGRFALITSLYLLEEFAHVLSYRRIAKRLCLREDEVAALLAALLDGAEVTSGELQLPGVTRDPADIVDIDRASVRTSEDDPVVACAVEGKADYIVSGDQDILVLEEYEDIQIVTPRQFVEILGT